MAVYFSPQSVALAVIGFYPHWYEGKLRDIADIDKVRGDLALEFLKQAQSSGYQIVLVDGGSAEVFLKRAKEIPNVHLHAFHASAVKRSPKKQRAYLLAAKLADVKVIVSAEMEKVDIVRNIAEIVMPILSGKADIVIPQREDALFRSSYPYFQYISESQANRAYNNLLQTHGLLSRHAKDLDILFGPIVFRNTPKILALFLQRVKFRKYEDGKFPSEFHDPDQYSNAYFFPTVMALKNRLSVIGVKIPFSYPKIQKENEEHLRDAFKEKRKLQRGGILSNLEDFLFYLNHNHNSKMI